MSLNLSHRFLCKFNRVLLASNEHLQIQPAPLTNRHPCTGSLTACGFILRLAEPCLWWFLRAVLTCSREVSPVGFARVTRGVSGGFGVFVVGTAHCPAAQAQEQMSLNVSVLFSSLTCWGSLEVD